MVTQVVVKLRRGVELLKRQMHAVAPVVVRVGGLVDLLVVRVLAAQSAVGRQPVLKRDDAEHRRAFQVQVEDLAADPRLGVIGGLAALVEHVVEILLSGVTVGLPPCADARHVVGRRSADGEVGIVPCVAKLQLRVFRHALDLEREDLELMHHGRHAVGYHAEVLGAAEHARGVDERRQLPHRLAIPEVVVAVIVEVVVETVEAPFLVVAQVAELI